jgi:Tfp pilus assembly protein PilF
LIAACTAQLASGGEVAPQVEALVARAAAYTKKHQNDRALADLSRALALDGDNLAALKARAHGYYDDSQYDRAIQDFNLQSRDRDCARRQQYFRCPRQRLP